MNQPRMNTDEHRLTQDATDASPSPLNGERAGVRGENIVALSKWESVRAEPPLTLTLSPLRGEGTKGASPISERGSGSHSAWAMFGVLRVIDPRSGARRLRRVCFTIFNDWRITQS
jgi:hypothetical protein